MNIHSIQTTRDEIMRSVAITGYRPMKLPFGFDLDHPDAIRLRAMLKTEYEQLINHGFQFFLTGGALGVDLMAAEVILELKEEYRRKRIRISHWLCLPCLDHDLKWNDADRERLARIMEKSNTVYVSETPYYNGCMQVRNRYMVDTSRVLLGVYDGQKGGTHSTIEYAKKKNRKIIILNPKTFMRIDMINTPGDIDYYPHNI